MARRIDVKPMIVIVTKRVTRPFLSFGQAQTTHEYKERGTMKRMKLKKKKGFFIFSIMIEILYIGGMGVMISKLPFSGEVKFLLSLVFLLVAAGTFFYANFDHRAW